MGADQKPSLFASAPIAAPPVARPPVATPPAPQTIVMPPVMPPVMPTATQPKRSFLETLQAFAGIGNLLIFAYIFIGEIILPDHMRATTFLGKRLGGIQGETALYAAPQQADAAAIVDSAKAEIEIRKSCEISVREAARGYYTQCLSSGGGSVAVCELKTEIFRNAHDCDVTAGSMH